MPEVLPKLPDIIAADHRLASFVEKEFDEILAKKTKLYGGDAMEALRDLATMPIDENSYMMAVKRQACVDLIRLMKPEDQAPVGKESDSLLAELNREYHRSAPRIREIRERVVTFERGEEQEPTVIDAVAP